MEPKIVKTQQSSTQAASSQMGLKLDLSKTYQRILGFGGAVTDAVAYHYDRFNPTAKAGFRNQYWGSDSIGYSVGRVPMNSVDFSRMNYALQNVSGDTTLDTFCLRDDTATNVPCGTDYKADLLKEVQDASPEFRLFVSTWSAPSWLKSQHWACDVKAGLDVCHATDAAATPPTMVCNNSVADPTECESNKQGQPCPTTPTAAGSAGASGTVTGAPSPTPESPIENAAGNCFNTGFLNRTLQGVWALFFSKFIDAYKAKGVDIWGLTVQNEPLAQAGLWPARLSSAAGQVAFVSDHLGPLMRQKHPGVKIMIYDDQLPTLIEFAGEILKDTAALDYIDGVAYHWYNTLQATYENSKPEQPGHIGPVDLADNFVGGGVFVGELWRQLQNVSTDKFMLASEACNGYSLGTEWVGPRPGDWGYGYSYSHDVLWQLRNGAAGWTDWNLMLDQKGGPNVAGNFVDSPVVYLNETSFRQNPSFFHLAHYSKYVTHGSKRVEIEVECGAREKAYCQAVAFQRPDGYGVVVLTNDEITVGPVAGAAGHLGMLGLPALARGQGSFTLGEKSLTWTVACGPHQVRGTIPWKAIQTVVLPCS